MYRIFFIVLSIVCKRPTKPYTNKLLIYLLTYIRGYRHPWGPKIIPKFENFFSANEKLKKNELYFSCIYIEFFLKSYSLKMAAQWYISSVNFFWDIPLRYTTTKIQKVLFSILVEVTKYLGVFKNIYFF